MNRSIEDITTSKLGRAIILIFVFFCGFANLATEIIGPRLFASLYGSTTVIWAIIISVTLLGISVGYYLGGRVPRGRILKLLPMVMLVDAAWLLSISWLVWEIPAQLIMLGTMAILITASIAFFIPAMLFSMASPLSITMLSMNRPNDEISKIVGNVLAIGTVGSILGALAAAFYFIPWVGLTLSLRIFALGCVVFAIFFSVKKLLPTFIIVFMIVMFFPQPNYRWTNDLVLLKQSEGYYQTIRVYTDNQTFVRMNLGPSYETEMDLRTGEPRFEYAKRMIDLTGDVKGKNILIIGGAGHTQARALENSGAIVTEVEIDPFVVKFSDQFFGPIHGKVVIQDGRTYIKQAQADYFDYVFVDAFSAPDSVPPQLTTIEFFQEVAHAMVPNGRMFYNFIGYPSGPNSASYYALSRTMREVFLDVRASAVLQPIIQNILLVGSQKELDDNDFMESPREGALLTDDLNPIEIFLEQTKGRDLYYYR